MGRAAFHPRLRMAAAVAALTAAGAAHAGAWGLCDRPREAGAGAQDRMLRFAAAIGQALDGSGQMVALIARSGMDLGRFGIRDSHAGIALKPPGSGGWSVRQLYYACDASRPRLYDQGLPGFILGRDDPRTGHATVVLLPGAPGAALEGAALDGPTALSLLAADYSANAYAYSTRYQNCNQWVAEMLARAWSPWDASLPARAQAQHWLRAQGYAPAPIEVGSHALMFAAHFAPLVHVDDHPLEDLQALHFRASLPAAIEDFARQQVPGAQRIGFCHDLRKIVIHRGWDPFGAECEPVDEDDEVIALDP
ncbi:DUF2145 domain-containing protein [Paracidovorax anthurii]|uniref:DUF2145 domain-containing protein n=2 Tax=Paracidovorax anthurii TaxID=78229 RepID=A0A328YBT3_9BURK|nr:DUF2145 domain-containing protein [Paracidovorax anthurii]RAR71399.1 hypothetical protein AX018_11029 [Paracidovorax anthurii]